MFVIALGGLVANLVGLLALHSGKDSNLNIRGAWLHVLTDALGSVGTIVGALLVWRFGWTWADPAVSVLISLLVIYSAWQLLRDSVSILMEGTPAHIDVAEVRAAIADIPNVRDVHDLHIWSITSGLHALSAHVVAKPEQNQQILTDVHEMLFHRFHIGHSTVQCEPPEFVEAECATRGS
jgi:cobalt-zinc-cadmium efflux system protein